MDDNITTWIIFIIMGVLILGPTILLTGYYITRMRGRRPEYYGKKVSSILRKYGGIRRFKVIDHLQLDNGKKIVVVPHLLIGYFGLLLVSTLDRRGSYFGDAKSPKWVYDDSQTKEDIPNPYQENQEAILQIRALLAKHKVYKTPIQQLIIYDSYTKKSRCFVGSDVPIMRLSKLRGYLQKAMFDKDNDVDVTKIYDILLKEGALVDSSAQ